MMTPKMPDIGDVIMFLLVVLAIGGMVGSCAQTGCSCDGPGIHIRFGTATRPTE